jgi:phenylpropionate dioxygenase-like ring-hydroxylating dioxygenase large terminal subunit
MRRFWHTICLSLELTDTPRYIKLFNEELVIIRDKSGDIGIYHAHCCHHGALLEYGHIQEHGIACSYHGWKFISMAAARKFLRPRVGKKKEPALPLPSMPRIL